MSQPQEEDLPQRIRDLERSCRRWRGLALGLLALMVVFIIAGAGLGLVQTARVGAERAAREHLRQAEAEQDRAGRVRQQAVEGTGKGKGP
jgi:hypothetical protein